MGLCGLRRDEVEARERTESDPVGGLRREWNRPARGLARLDRNERLVNLDLFLACIGVVIWPVFS